jgi:hypothetical protein
VPIVTTDSHVSVVLLAIYSVSTVVWNLEHVSITVEHWVNTSGKTMGRDGLPTDNKPLSRLEVSKADRSRKPIQNPPSQRKTWETAHTYMGAQRATKLTL